MFYLQVCAVVLVAVTLASAGYGGHGGGGFGGGGGHGGGGGGGGHGGGGYGGGGGGGHGGGGGGGHGGGGGGGHGGHYDYFVSNEFNTFFKCFFCPYKFYNPSIEGF